MRFCQDACDEIGHGRYTGATPWFPPSGRQQDRGQDRHASSTEWGTTIADGGGQDKRVYAEAAQQWLRWAAKHQLSWANWSVMDKDEASAILPPDPGDEDGLPKVEPDKGHWPVNALSTSGRWVREQIRNASAPAPVAGTAD